MLNAAAVSVSDCEQTGQRNSKKLACIPVPKSAKKKAGGSRV